MNAILTPIPGVGKGSRVKIRMSPLCCGLLLLSTASPTLRAADSFFGWLGSGDGVDWFDGDNW